MLEVINSSLREGVVPALLKEAVIHPLLKEPNLDPGLVINLRPVANLPFLGKVLEHVVAEQLQALLDERGSRRSELVPELDNRLDEGQ